MQVTLGYRIINVEFFNESIGGIDLHMPQNKMSFRFEEDQTQDILLGFCRDNIKETLKQWIENGINNYQEYQLDSLFNQFMEEY